MTAQTPYDQQMPFGMSPERSVWELAIERYEVDEVLDARSIIETVGVGDLGNMVRWYRLIEYEALTRQRSVYSEINKWLTIEYIEGEAGDIIEITGERVLSACDTAAKILGYEHSNPVLITILVDEAEGPWESSPYGYFYHKEPYDKICLPLCLIQDPEEVCKSVMHEYSHVITDSMSDGYAPRWLEEAISVMIEESAEDKPLDIAQWLTAPELEWCLENPQSTDDDLYHAYQQCGAIGRYLVSEYGVGSISKLLLEHANEGRLHNLLRLARNKTRSEEAIRRTFRQTIAKLFEKASRYSESALKD